MKRGQEGSGRDTRSLCGIDPALAYDGLILQILYTHVGGTKRKKEKKKKKRKEKKILNYGL